MSSAGEHTGAPEASASTRQQAPDPSPRVPLPLDRIPQDLQKLAHLFSTDVDRLSEEDEFDPTTASPETLNDYIFVLLTERITEHQASLTKDSPIIARNIATADFADWAPEHFHTLNAQLRRYLRGRLALFHFDFFPNSGNLWDQIYLKIQEHYKERAEARARGSRTGSPAAPTRQPVAQYGGRPAERDRFWGRETTPGSPLGQRDVQFTASNLQRTPGMPRTPAAPRRVVRAPTTPFTERGIPAEVFGHDQLVTPIEKTALKRIAALKKMYLESDKYDGHLPYESLSRKVVSFRERWDRSGIDLHFLTENVAIMLRGPAKDFYQLSLAGQKLSFQETAEAIMAEFETKERQTRYENEWEALAFQDLCSEVPDKKLPGQVEFILHRIRNLCNVLPAHYSLDDMKIRAVRHIFEPTNKFNNVFSTVHADYAAVCASLHAAADQAERRRARKAAAALTRDNNTFMVERKFQPVKGFVQKPLTPKKCLICRKEGCWSSNHTAEERDAAWQARRAKRETAEAHFQNDRTEPSDSSDQEEETDSDSNGEIFFTELQQELNGADVARQLSSAALLHRALATEDVPATDRTDAAYSQVNGVFLLHHETHETFHGFLPDTGASNVSTAGQAQTNALIRLIPALRMVPLTAESNIKFGIGTTSANGQITVNTPIGPITFHVVSANTPFLICIQDLKRLGVLFDTPADCLWQGTRRVPLLYKNGHPWLVYDNGATATAYYLTEKELRQVHRRFGHPSVQKLAALLQAAGEDYDKDALHRLTEVCKQCQIHGQTPRRFKFSLQDPDLDFNHEIKADICQIEGHNVLHVVDRATAFQAARFIKDMSAATVWRATKNMWIDTYVGPPDVIRHDAGTNFASREFKASAQSLHIETVEVPVEAHNSIGKNERYHAVLRRAYETLRKSMPEMTRTDLLQTAVKAVNDTAGPDGLVPTLLVFGTS